MNNSSKVWSNKKSLLNQLEKLWDKGLLLQESVCSSNCFPKRLSFKTPDSKALSYDFAAVRCWVADIQKLKGFRIVYKTVRHPVIGENRVPVEVWVDTLETAIALLNKQAQVTVFSQLYKQTIRHTPELIKWLKQYPLKALGLAEAWPKLLDFVRWTQQHPRPDIYLRQVSLAGIDSKFIEQHRHVLTALLDLALAAEQINDKKTGIKQFEQRYGFRSKPEKIRFRLLDTGLALPPGLLPGADNDFSVTANDFQRLQQNAEFMSLIKRVFITENEINFLSFPAQRNSLVIFGSGYGFDALAKAQWLSQLAVFYWGDIDSHGFAILDQLRNKFPHVQSLLMDETTLMKHGEFWGYETKQENRELHCLTNSEQNIYQALLNNHYAEHLRLEQERVDYKHLLGVLSSLEQSDAS
jgi:hypothetical protein